MNNKYRIPQYPRPPLHNMIKPHILNYIKEQVLTDIESYLTWAGQTKYISTDLRLKISDLWWYI